jgi:hypothetical protein
MLQSDPMNAGRICFCITGWHYSESVYSACSETGHDIYVISHHPESSTPGSITHFVPREHLFFEPNLGYDWGGYQQFIARGMWRSYEAIFFLHDDIKIRSLDFIPHSLDLLRAGAQVVGNGLNSAGLNWPRTHLQCYAHSGWLPASIGFEHQTVRGSFFAMTSQALEKVQRFEVFWDPKHVYLRFGNHSLIATCGKLTALFGQDCFAFLSPAYRNSPYIEEQERAGQARPSPTLKQRLAVTIYKALGRVYVSRRMQLRSRKPFTRSLGDALKQLDGVARDATF